MRTDEVVEFSRGEVMALRTIVATLVAGREDLIGAVMETGAFHYLEKGNGVVDLVDKLQRFRLTHPAHEGLNESCPRRRKNLGEA